MKKRLCFKTFLLALACFGIVSCSNQNQTASSEASSDATTSEKTLIDFVSQAKLSKDYKGKSFLSDGIGQVDLYRKVDGDTAHFYPHGTKSNLIKARYNCIDTPESTGTLEPWGSGASARNGELLNSAKTIVLSTDSTDQGDKGDVPVVDSTGGRYLTYIWVSEKEDADYSELTLVNLVLVQEGWSKAKGASGKDYGTIFLNANNQAMSEKLHVWSDERDPDFNYDAASECTLKNIVESKDTRGNDFDWVGSKATFKATVAAIGPDTGACYLNEDIDGKRYGIYVFTQYKVLQPLQKIGNKVQITGTVARFGGSDEGEGDDEGTLQLVDAHWSYYQQEEDIVLLEKGDGTYEPKSGTVAELSKEENINVICSVSDSLTCYGGKAVQNTAASSAYAFTLYCKNSSGDTLNIRIPDSMAIYPGDEAGGDPTKTRVSNLEYFKSATSIKVSGALVTYYGRYQIKLCSRQGITVSGADASKAN